MYVALAAVLHDARERLQLGQLEVARRLGLGQQTVSSWERGRSRPRRSMLGRVADVLELKEHALVDLGLYAGGTSPQSAGQGVPPLMRSLPINGLPPERFEDLTVEILQVRHPGGHATRFGGPGEKQYGIDVLVAGDVGDNIATAQCKRQAEFGPAAVTRAVTSATIDAAQHHLFLSRLIASPGARREIAKYPGWQLWDGEDISRFIRNEMERERAVRLVDTYFPGLREPFLGVPRPGPWLAPEDVFGVSQNQLFTQDWQLVGRRAELQRLVAGLYDQPHGLMLLSGRGGLGKTRLLRAVAEAAPDPSVRVCVLSGGQPVDPRDYELLPSDRRLVVLIDDAHEFDAISPIVAGIWRQNATARILLVTRPYRWQALRSDLGRRGLLPDKAPTVELKDLRLTEAEALARDALGDEASGGVVQRLARVTLDCPLITVLGGGLIRLGRLDPTQLDQDDQIRETILERFQEALVADPIVADPETRAATLDAIAAFQPVRTDAEEFQTTVAAVVGKPWDVVERHIGRLEDAGVIRRRGASIRVAPDLLGDVVLARACWDRRGRRATGYLDRLRKASDGQPLQHLFVNACRLDWQVRQQADAAVSLVDDLWALVEDELKDGDIPTRRAVLQILAGVAYFQARRAVKLAKWVIENPTDDTGPEQVSWRYIGVPSYQDVLDRLAPVLRHAAYTFETLPEALNLLWHLAQTDTRATNQTPDHALRVLTELADYEIGKPVQFNHAVVDIASRWFELADAISPFEVLRALLATEGSRETYQEFALTFQPFALNVDVVAPIRDRVVFLALQELVNPDVRRAAVAAETLGHALRYPTGLFGREVSDDEHEPWTPVFVDTIKRMRGVIADHELDPVVLIAVRDALHWHANHSRTATKDAAKAAIAALRSELPDQIALIIYDGWGHLLREYGDYSATQARVQERLDRAIAALLELDDKAASGLLLERLSQQKRAFGATKGVPGPLVSAYVKARPLVATPLIDLILSGEQPALAPLLPVILASEAELNPPGGVARARKLLARADDELTQSVAQALGWNRGQRPLEDGEFEILLGFAAHRDVNVRHAAITVGQRLAQDNVARAVELIASVDFRDAPKLADELFMSFTDAFGLAWSAFSKPQRSVLRTRLVSLAAIEGYWIEQFLADRSAEDPAWVVELLQERVNHAEELGSASAYRPTPFNWNHHLRVREHPAFAMHLKRLHAWLAAESAPFIRKRYGVEVFRAVAGQYDDTVLGVLSEALRSTTPSDVETVARILAKAHRTLIWDRPDFVRTALAAAERIGPPCRDLTVSALWGATISGVRTGAPGQPYSQDIEQRDRSRVLAQTMPLGSTERAFYEDMATAAEENIRRSVRETPDDGRNW